MYTGDDAAADPSWKEYRVFARGIEKIAAKGLAEVYLVYLVPGHRARQSVLPTKTTISRYVANPAEDAH
jgi:hypothetical protein